MLTQIKLWFAAAKLYILVFVYVASIGSSVYITSKYWINHYKAGSLDAANAMTLINNNTNKLIAEHNAEIERMNDEAKEAAANVKPLIITDNCDDLLADIDRMSDDLIDSLP